jgi:uncharacterized protein (TIGR00369 family)
LQFPVTQTSRLALHDIDAFLRRDFPQLYIHGDIFSVIEIGHGMCRMQMAYHESQLRPGGTISGPAMMALADVALYVALLGAIGEVPLAVTTNFSINFLKKPAPRPLIADCRYMKIGKTLAVGEANLLSEGEDGPVAHVTATYAIPAR